MRTCTECNQVADSLCPDCSAALCAHCRIFRHRCPELEEVHARIGAAEPEVRAGGSVTEPSANASDGEGSGSKGDGRSVIQRLGDLPQATEQPGPGLGTIPSAVMMPSNEWGRLALHLPCLKCENPG